MSAKPTEGGTPGEIAAEKPVDVAEESPAEPSPPHPALRATFSPGGEEGGSTPALPKGFASASDRRAEPVAPAPAPKQSWFQRLKAGLFRTSSQLTQQISSLFTKRKLDDDTLEELEELLIRADLGVETAMRVTGALSAERYGRDVTGEDVSRIMAGEIEKVLAPVARPLELDLNHKPHVILVVGVNGTGKTTTIGKLAAKLSGAGLKVMLAAGDTFRAAAIEQLKIWAGRTGSEFIGTQLGADAAGLAYDAYKRAIEKRSDVLIIDTAGRLQNKAELMAELEKIVRVLGKLDPDAPHTVLQTLDATTGQNALQQVEIFRNVAGVSGLVMTKLDGTARGGILGQLDRRAIRQPEIDRLDIAFQQLVVLLKRRQRMHGAGKVLHAQIPAASADADIRLDALLNVRPVRKLLCKCGGLKLGAVTHEERQAGELVVAQRRDHGSVLLDQRKLVAMLPDAVSRTLGELDFDRARINLAHFRVLDPGKRHELFAGTGGTEEDDGRRAIETQLLQNVDFRRLQVAGHLHVVDGKADGGGRRLGDGARVPAHHHAVKAGGRK